MKLKQPLSLQEISNLLKARSLGPENILVSGINEIHMVEPGDLTFVDHPKYYDKALNSKATTILINKEVMVPEGKNLIISNDPFRDYNFLTKYFAPIPHPIDGKYSVGKNTKIGNGCIIYPGVVICDNVSIDDNCILYPNVVIYPETQIGKHVIIHAGSVIGSDAFYYKKRTDHYEKMHSCGGTHLADWVEIGSNCSVDRGVSGITRIGQGTKLDNQVHIGHDTVIGKNCIIAAQTGIAGVTTLEDDVILWGQVGVTKDITIGKGAIVSAKSGVSKSLEGGKSYFGVPAREFRKAYKELAALAKLAADK